MREPVETGSQVLYELCFWSRTSHFVIIQIFVIVLIIVVIVLDLDCHGVVIIIFDCSDGRCRHWFNYDR